MKRTAAIPCLVAATLACLLAAGCKKSLPPGPDVWAEVNGKQITRAEVEKGYRSQLNPDAPPPSHEEALSMQLNILDQMINTTILLQRATEMNLAASDGEVEDKFTETKSPYTEDDFERQLAQKGLTVDDLKGDIRRQLSIQKLLNKEIGSKVTVTDQDVADYYNQNKSQFNVTEPQFHLAQIVITTHPDPNVHNRKNDKAQNEAQAGRKAAMLDQKIQSGADFTQLAMDYSEDATASSGGDLGFVPQSSLDRSDPALKRAVLALKPGQASRAIATRNGYTFVKLIARIPSGQRLLSDPEVQQSIRDLLRNRREQLLQAAYLAEMRNQAHVANYLARQILESAGKLPSTQ